ncbi:hypothetical protein CcaCcLH18_04040 [Colletotrichum camelliae]|nr:hypothetical protein CcaCcLH18_04040 [Colletotrichum camelliae]
MKASVVTLALFGAAAIANPVAVEKREVEPRALPSVPALAGITGGTGFGDLGSIPVVTGLVNAGDVLVTLTTLLQTILNTLQTFRSGIPGNALAPITGITGVSGLIPPVSALPAGTNLTPEQAIALATSLQYQLGNLTALAANLPTGGLLGGGVNAATLTSFLNGVQGLQAILGPFLNAGGALSNLGGLGGALGGGAVPNLGPLQLLQNALAPVISIVTGALSLLTGGLLGGLLGGGLGGGIGL